MSAHAATDRSTEFHHQVESILDGGLDSLARDLANLLVELSARINKARRAVTQGSAVARDLGAMDEAFERAVSITRTMNNRLLSPRPRGVLASVNQVVCELAALVGPAMPAGTTLVATYPYEPCVVACSPCQLRRSLVAVLAAIVEGAEARGEVRLTVRTRTAGGDRASTHLGIDIECSGSAISKAPAAWALAVTAARELARSLQASLAVTVDATTDATLSLECPLVR